MTDQFADFFFKKQQLPPNWFSRVDPYTIPLVAAEIAAQYFLHPVAFGGNTGRPNTFVGVGSQGPYISNSTLTNSTPAGVACLLYQVATENIPSAVGGGGEASAAIPASSLSFMRNTLNPLFTNSSLSGAAAFGCPIVTGTAS